MRVPLRGVKNGDIRPGGSIETVFSLWFAVHAHEVASEYVRVLSEEIRAVSRDDLLGYHLLNSSSKFSISEIGRIAWKKMALLDWKEYVNKAAMRVIADADSYTTDGLNQHLRPEHILGSSDDVYIKSRF